MKLILENWRRFLNERFRYDAWYKNLTKPSQAEGPSPAFRIMLPTGKLSENPRDYPTAKDIKKDSNFCPTADWLPGERRGYRTNKPLVDGYHLHLYFDRRGFMILKDMKAPKGRPHTGGSHYDYFGTMTKGCGYNLAGVVAHGVGEVLPGKIKDLYKTYVDK
jgi:hypothetical protein